MDFLESTKPVKEPWRDYAAKEWLRSSQTEDDSFQLLQPDFAIFLLIVGGFIGYMFRGYL